ncbi:MAG: hypothetical protein HQL58_02670, partial [Magnetococcales bacterium]|nr:hypothetical protein [Magnetococcales bacterium]
MQTTPDEQIIKKARPFFLNYFKRLENDLNTLTSAPVTCTIGDVSLLHGRDDLEQAFEVDRAVAQVVEDGHHYGDMHILMDVSTAIALSGLMMMMGEAVIRELVKNRKYTDEIQEGFQEVANQTVGALNDLFEKKVEGGHLTLVLPTSFVQYGEFCDTLKDDATYLQVVSNIQIGNFPAAPTTWLTSRKVVEPLLGVVVAGTASEQSQDQAAQGGGGSGGGAASSASNVSMDNSASGQQGDAAAASSSSSSSAASQSASASASSSASSSSQSAGLGDDDATQLHLPGAAMDRASKELLSSGGSGQSDKEILHADARGGIEKQTLQGDARKGVEKEVLLPDSGDRSAGGVEMLDGYSLPTGVNTSLELPKLAYSNSDGLPAPDEPGSIKAVMTEPPFSMNEGERVMKAINAMRYEGARYIGV